MRPRLLLRICLILCVGLLVYPSTSAAATNQQLLTTYAPVMDYSHYENWGATAVSFFCGQADLQKGSQGSNALGWTFPVSSTQSPAPPVLPTSACTRASCYRLNLRDCSPGEPSSAECYADGLGSSPAYPGLPASRFEPLDMPTHYVYGHVWTNPSSSAPIGKVLEYFQFYGFDDWRQPPVSTYFTQTGVQQQHEGDWEFVAVALNRSGTPYGTIYSQHCTTVAMSWQDVPKWNGGNHPLDYVAVGSHANYYHVGTFAVPNCDPLIAVAKWLKLNAGVNVVPTDQTALSSDAGHVIAGVGFTDHSGTGNAVYRILDVLALGTSPEWVDFSGFFGEKQSAFYTKRVFGRLITVKPLGLYDDRAPQGPRFDTLGGVHPWSAPLSLPGVPTSWR